jgi:hypothetical protein
MPWHSLLPVRNLRARLFKFSNFYKALIMNLPSDLRLEQGELNRLLSAYSFGDPGVASLADGSRTIFEGRSVYLAAPRQAQVGPFIRLTEFLACSAGYSRNAGVTTLEDGGFVVTSDHPRSPGMGRAQVFDADGTPRGATFDIPDPPQAVIGVPGWGLCHCFRRGGAKQCQFL